MLDRVEEDAVDSFRDLRAEAAIRRLAARYMALCDVPATEKPGSLMTDLFTPDVVWEGVGAKAGQEFGRVDGRNALIAWFNGMIDPPRYQLNLHFLTSEAITAEGCSGNGTWVMFQAAIRTDEAGEIRAARLDVDFRMELGQWCIAHFRTRSVFRLDVGAARVNAFLQDMPQ